MMEQANSKQDLEKDFAVLKEIATALIHENADLKNEIDDKERELNLLYKVLREITYSMDWHEIQQTLLEIILEFFPVVTFCLIALFDQSSNGIRIRLMRRGNATSEADFLQLSESVDETIGWDEVVASNEWSEYFHKTASESGVQTSFIPLKLKARELGFLMIGKPAEVKYGKGEWRFLLTIAGHLAITLENAELYLLATTDELTRLFNRRYFIDRLGREIERAQRRGDSLCLLMMDIDRFKTVNDTFGHGAGDQVLVELASRIKQIVEGRGGIVCRYGGEEYTVVVPGTEGREAVGIAEEVRAYMEMHPFEFDSDTQHVSKVITVSIGVSVFPKDSSDPVALIAKADQALYIAKAEGRNKVISHQRF